MADSQVSVVLKVSEESKQAAVAAAAQTRSKTHVWLVGQRLNVLDGFSCSNRLPTAGEERSPSIL